MTTNGDRRRRPGRRWCRPNGDTNASGAASLEELHEAKRKAGWTDKTDEELNGGIVDDDSLGESEEVAELKMQLDNALAQIAESKGE